ncbi:MAG: hypothetical protein ACOX4C_07890 [Bacillota bacterium]|jgi:hypothetical protein
MRKRLAILVALVVMTMTLAGCRPAAKPWDETADRQNLANAVSAWVTGIEEYDIDAMVGDGVLAAGFKLTMKENETATPYTKDAARLLTELEEDEENQRFFREERGYRIELNYEWTIANISPSVAKVVGTFEVEEICDGMNDPWLSDRGEMVIEFEKGSSAWKMTAMNINFEGGVATKAVRPRAIVGFGFYKLVP